MSPLSRNYPEFISVVKTKFSDECSFSFAFQRNGQESMEDYNKIEEMNFTANVDFGR